MKVEFKVATKRHAAQLARRLGSLEKAEYQCYYFSQKWTPLKYYVEIKKQIECSEQKWSVFVDDELVMIYGAMTTRILHNECCLWLITSDAIEACKFTFLRIVKSKMQEMAKRYARAIVYVHEPNKKSLRWLKWCGFVEEKKTEFGFKGEMCYEMILKNG